MKHFISMFFKLLIVASLIYSIFYFFGYDTSNIKYDVETKLNYVVKVAGISVLIAIVGLFLGKLGLGKLNYYINIYSNDSEYCSCSNFITYWIRNIFTT